MREQEINYSFYNITVYKTILTSSSIIKQEEEKSSSFFPQFLNKNK